MARVVPEPKYPGGTLTLAEQIAPPTHKPLEWRVVVEPLEVGTDAFISDVILPHVEAGLSCTVLGPPGTGKTECLKKIAATLEAQGHRVAKISLAHVAARIIEGSTVHSFLARMVLNGTFKGVVLLDEISNEVLPLLAALDIARLGGARIICFGDFDQLPPISNSCRGNAVPDDVFQRSRLYKTWANSTMFKLTRARRCDPEHFKFYTTLPTRLEDAIKAAALRHPPNADADWNLVISNHRRRTISTRRQVLEARGHEVTLVPKGDDPEYPLFVGTRLIGCLTVRDAVNGAFYVVRAIAPVCVIEDELTKQTWEATPEELAKCTQLRHAMTYSKAQGQTLVGTVALWDLNSVHFTRRHLYVGTSRVKQGELLFVNV